MKVLSYPVLIAFLIITGCKSTKTASTSAGGGRYSEDLSVLRPKVEAPKDTVIAKVNTDDRKNTTVVDPKFSIDKKLDPILDSIDRINLSRKFVEGFTIQVYSGKREDALNTRKQLSSLVPDVTSEVQFTEPIFRVKAGKYYTWLDAQRDFALIKKYFPAAIIIPDKIAIN